MQKLALTLFLSGVLLLAGPAARAQTCEDIYGQAQASFTSADYDLALKKLAAYKLCAPLQGPKADALIFKIYQTINSQKKEAQRQRKIADTRALTIKAQKDSLERENIAGKAATQALQINQTDPNRAIQYIYAGLCFSPNNASLTEIQHQIFNSEVIRSPVSGASKVRTTIIARFNDTLLYAADAEGYIRFWDSRNRQFRFKIKAFVKGIRSMDRSDQGYILASGNDSAPVLKLIDVAQRNIRTIPTDSKVTFQCLNFSGEPGVGLLGNEKGDIYRFDQTTLSVGLLKHDSSQVISIQCWKDAKKTFYATPYGVYDLNTGKVVYRAKPGITFSYFSSNPGTWDMYIGMGSDLILYHYMDRTVQLLAAMHHALISSCSYADSTGSFMTTDLDGSAILWTASGSFKQALKGNRQSLYDSYLAPDESYALTAGAGLGLGSTDTNTVKYWFLSGFLQKQVKNTHQFGVSALTAMTSMHFFATADDYGTIKIWDNYLHQLDSRKLVPDGVSQLAWDPVSRQLVYGTGQGESGSIAIGPDGKLGPPRGIRTHAVAAIAGIQVRDGKIYSIGRDGLLFVQAMDNTRLDSIYFNSELTAIDCAPGHEEILLGCGNNAILYNPRTKTQQVFKQPIKINALAWLSETRFVTLSGQMLRIWDTRDNRAPIKQVDNNISNVMISLSVDPVSHTIYTGTWAGYVICWDYVGKQLFEFDLTTLHTKNRITGIAPNADRSRIITADSNGNLSAFYAPLGFLRQQLGLDMDCAPYLKLLK